MTDEDIEDHIMVMSIILINHYNLERDWSYLVS